MFDNKNLNVTVCDVFKQSCDSLIYFLEWKEPVPPFPAPKFNIGTISDEAIEKSTTLNKYDKLSLRGWLGNKAEERNLL